jgi:hypothetical protein
MPPTPASDRDLVVEIQVGRFREASPIGRAAT